MIRCRKKLSVQQNLENTQEFVYGMQSFPIAKELSERKNFVAIQ